MGWLSERFRDCRVGESGPLQIMYGIDGRTKLPEEVLTHLEGYRGSAPVRIGNGAVNQLQLDIYGALIDSVYLYNKYGTPIYHDSWLDLARIIEWLSEHWDQPDEGIWETRAGRQHFTYSRLMCWVAFERAVRVAHQRGLPGDTVSWMAARDKIYRQIMSRGWRERRRAFVQRYDADVLDASILLMPLVKFISPTDPAGYRHLTRSATSSSPTAWSRATTPKLHRTACKAEREPSRCAPSGTSKPSPAPATWTRRGSSSRRCLPTPTTSAFTPSRSGLQVSSWATSPRPSHTWH